MDMLTPALDFESFAGIFALEETTSTAPRLDKCMENEKGVLHTIYLQDPKYKIK